PWTVTVAWGDGSANTTFNATTTGSLGNQSHTYGEEGNYTVTVTVTDTSDSLAGSANFNVNVSDPGAVVSGLPVGAAPGVAFSGTATVRQAATAAMVMAAVDQGAVEGAAPTSFNLGSFTDNSAGPWTVTVNWGDGSAPTTFAMNTQGTITAQSHSYSEEGPN